VCVNVCVHVCVKVCVKADVNVHVNVCVKVCVNVCANVCGNMRVTVFVEHAQWNVHLKNAPALPDRWASVQELPEGQRKLARRKVVLGFAIDPTLGNRFVEFTDQVLKRETDSTKREWVPWHQALHFWGQGRVLVRMRRCIDKHGSVQKSAHKRRSTMAHKSAR
jgi:hypothetical protein